MIEMILHQITVLRAALGALAIYAGLSPEQLDRGAAAYHKEFHE